MAIPPYSTLDELIEIYSKRIIKDSKNQERVKKLYHDDITFTQLMNKIIEKDYRRHELFVKSLFLGIKKDYPTPWNVFFTILNIVQEDGVEIPPFDILTKKFQSKSLMYRGWTFSWIHEKNTLISVYNEKGELIYQI